MEFTFKKSGINNLRILFLFNTNVIKCTFKNSGINNLKGLFLLHRLNLLEKRIKNVGHLTNFLSGEHNLPLPPTI